MHLGERRAQSGLELMYCHCPGGEMSLAAVLLATTQYQPFYRICMIGQELQPGRELLSKVATCIGSPKSDNLEHAPVRHLQQDPQFACGEHPTSSWASTACID
jgi:hypothetical protein